MLILCMLVIVENIDIILWTEFEASFNSIPISEQHIDMYTAGLENQVSQDFSKKYGLESYGKGFWSSSTKVFFLDVPILKCVFTQGVCILVLLRLFLALPFPFFVLKCA